MNGQLAYAQYDMDWRKGESWLATAEGQQHGKVTVGEMIRVASPQQAALAGAKSLTTYSVTAALAGKKRSYQAAFLWTGEARKETSQFLALDHITQGVAEAARENLATFEEYIKKPFAEPEPIPLATCRTWSDTQYDSPHVESYNEHISGGPHYSDPDFQAVCSCTNTCQSRCDATGSSLECADGGGLTTTACHKMASAYDADTQIQGDGHVTAATCSVGFGCIMKSCAFCSCGLTVSVQASGATVSFSSPDSPSWSGNLKMTRTCPKCTQ
ncbi:hypothetical protein [Stigmatella aurantiaca]|nr:hypothetical protein [Stigmatella aurantiaca]